MLLCIVVKSVTSDNCANEENLAKLTETSGYVHLTSDCTWRIEVNPGMLSKLRN